jgi:hypothetical protein
MRRMNRMLPTWILVAGSLCAAVTTAAAGDKLLKVLPHYLDLEGKHALSPSLFERDAYQAMLRDHPEKRGGLQFDVQWKARKPAARALELRLELVTTHYPKGQAFSVDVPLDPRWRLERWHRLKLDRSLMDKLGEVVAWRVTLRENGRELSERKSFLW